MPPREPAALTEGSRVIPADALRRQEVEIREQPGNAASTEDVADTSRPPPLDLRRSAAFLIITVLLTAATLVLGYGNKARCVGPQFTPQGQSQPDLATRVTRDACYSDIQYLWSGRQLYLHVFPYLHGSYDPVGREISGGTLEYPVLTGLTVYLTALPATNDAQYLLFNAIVLAICGLACGLLLGRLAGLRSWWWALSPPLVLYAFHNWDLLAVVSVVGAFAVLAGCPTARRPGIRLLMVAALLGVGGAIKFYPLMFSVPVAIWVGLRFTTVPVPTGEPHSRQLRESDTARRAWGGWGWALAVLVMTAAVFAAINLPFLLGGFRGWWASFQFQWSRPIDSTTNSIWFWGARPYSDPENLAGQARLGRLSALATAVGLIAAVLAGLLRRRSTGDYPWLQVCAAMLAAYLVLNKVNSPQYALWLLPFFVLLRIRWGWIVAYFVADAALGIGFFRWQYLLLTGRPSDVYDSVTMQIVMIGVWGRVALLIGLFGAFLLASSVLDERGARIDGRQPDRLALPV